MYSGTKDGKTYGFYLAPAGLKNSVKLTDAEHMALIDGQAAGKVITWDAPDYKPKLAEAPKPTKAELAQQRKQAILSELADIDAKTTRPLRAILSDAGTKEDKEKLAELEAQAETLRTELSSL